MVLVTGGTGLVGSHLLFRLVEKGQFVRAIHRRGSDLDQVKKTFSYYSDKAIELFERIEWVEADINDIPSLEIAFKDVSRVYHCAALISFDPKAFYKLRKINVKGTSNIVNLCLSYSIEKLCYTSTIGTIGKAANGEISNEDTEWTEAEANVYSRSKYAAEMEVWRGSQEGLSVAMVNPGVIIGPTKWNHGSGSLFSLANRAFKYYPPGGSGFVSVNDVVRLLMLLMDSSIKNERYIMVAENLSFHEILKRLTMALGKKPPSKQLKFWQLEVLRLFDYFRCQFSGKKRSITKSWIRSLKKRQVYDNRKAVRDLNFTFEDLSESIEITSRCFLTEHS